MKRAMDVAVSLFGLMLLGPLLLLVIGLIWLQDRRNPLYRPLRASRHGGVFRMVKLRTMRVDADRTGGSSTASDDRRITPVGHLIRRYKLDEFAQLWNVFVGDMSLVGPRPNLKEETDDYTREEQVLLSVRPGITDFASIVFADEGDILSGRPDPDLAYQQLIRPWKSRLGILYVQRQSLMVDIQLVLLTLTNIISRPTALKGVEKLLSRLGAEECLIGIAGRRRELVPHPPPGMKTVVSGGSAS